MTKEKSLAGINETYIPEKYKKLFSQKENKEKTFRFFYHFYKQKGKMSIHFKKSCTVVDNIICNVKCETKWKPTQPKLVMQGFAKNVTIENNVAIII